MLLLADISVYPAEQCRKNLMLISHDMVLWCDVSNFDLVFFFSQWLGGALKMKMSKT